MRRFARRLERAREEIAAQDEFDIQIVNDDLETALQALESAIFTDTGENHPENEFRRK